MSHDVTKSEKKKSDLSYDMFKLLLSPSKDPLYRNNMHYFKRERRWRLAGYEGISGHWQPSLYSP